MCSGSGCWPPKGTPFHITLSLQQDLKSEDGRRELVPKPLPAALCTICPSL